jgi:predicted DsbA family dithiol-disulfide isomerase
MKAGSPGLRTVGPGRALSTLADSDSNRHPLAKARLPHGAFLPRRLENATLPTFAKWNFQMFKTLKVDVFTDVVCPWCLIGSARLDKALAELPDDVVVEVENHPFYLDPNVPPEGVVVADMLRQKYGREPKDMWARVESEAEKAGIDLDLSQQPRMYPTAKAHTLSRLAKPLGTQHALANAIAEAYFLDHRQINEDTVLADLAAAHGFDRDEALRLINDPQELAITEGIATAAAAQGISGVPFFVFGEKYSMSGAQPQEVFGMALEKTLSEL